MSGVIPVSISNKSLDFYKNQVFQSFLDIEGLTEIAVNRPGEIWTEINGDWTFHNNDGVTFDFCKRFSQTLASFRGDEIGDTKPLLSATLESGERVQVVFPPACERNTISITIRKPSTRQITHKEYVANGFYDYVQSGKKHRTYDDELLDLFRARNIAAFMELAVAAGKTIVFAGATGSGKTTLLNMLSFFISRNEIIVTIEDTPELKLQQPNVRRFQIRNSVNDDMMNVDQQALVKASLRMRPDRIILGEIRDGTVVDLVSAASTGHDGTMCTVHANDPENLCNVRIPILYTMNKAASFSERSIAMQFAEAFQLIVQIQHFPDGSRKITQITHVNGTENGHIRLHDIFRYNEQESKFKATGYFPDAIIKSIENKGISFNRNILKRAKET